MQLNEIVNKNNQKLFYKLLVSVFLIRLFFAAWLPITGDEAYFIIWGKNLDYGYYDHTPFVGWLLSALLVVSDASWWLRLPAVLLPIVLAYWIYKILKNRQPETAAWVALVFLVAPVNIINIFITTDTPLILFSFISAWYFYRALYESQNFNYFIFSGIFLGLAFFSKYFAVFLGIAFGIYILVFHRNRRMISGLFIIFLMVMPFVLINLYWNYTHCWNNILFNLFNRTAGADDPLVSLIKYLGMLVYLFSPFLIYFIIKNKTLLKQQYADKFSRTYIWLISIPLFLFLLLVVRKEVGLHWVFSFYPFAFIAVAGVLSVKQWRSTFHFMWVFSLLHLAGLTALMTLPVENFASKSEAMQSIVFGKYPDDVLAYLKPYENDYVFSTISYGLSSVASYQSRKHFIVFNKGSFHAREDDRLTDFKALNGKNILIFKRLPVNLERLKQYFTKTERKTFSVHGVTFELLLGNNFNYELYRKKELVEVNRDYYSIPDWLPVGRCEFKDKYGFK